MIAGFTSRRKNVPGQVKSNHTSLINKSKQILTHLKIGTDGSYYIYHKQRYFVKGAPLLLYLKDGATKRRYIGVKTSEEILEWLNGST
mgnify:CR=1 FL=1